MRIQGLNDGDKFYKRLKNLEELVEAKRLTYKEACRQVFKSRRTLQE